MTAVSKERLIDAAVAVVEEEAAAALRRRGLVEFVQEPGCFVQAVWRISEAGAELVRDAGSN